MDRPEPANPAHALLQDQAYTTLKRLILGEIFPPGSFLSERQLVRELGGMSKTPIKIALERLQGEGLIRVSPKQGILVRELSVHEITDVFDLRIALETFVMERIAGRIAPEQRALIEENFAGAERCIRDGDEATYADLDAAFHTLLCAILDNREILQIMQRNHDKLARVILRVLRRDKERMVSSQADHRGIAEALFAGDGVLAAARVREHLEYGKRALIS